MIFVDTNYFLRFLLADNLPQHQETKKLFLQAADGKIKLYTSLLVYFEIYWVLTSFYQKNKTSVTNILEELLNLKFLKIDNLVNLRTALTIYKESNLDLEDSYNLAYMKAKKINELKTFDIKLQKEFMKYHKSF